MMATPKLPPPHSSEVFSLVRKSKLGKRKYVDRFFDTGHEYPLRFVETNGQRAIWCGVMELTNLWAVSLEIVDGRPDDHDPSGDYLVGVYSSEDNALEAKSRAAKALRVDLSVRWTVEPVQLNAVDWDTGFVEISEMD